MKKILIFLMPVFLSIEGFCQCSTIASESSISVPATCTDLCTSSGSDISSSSNNKLCSCTSVSRGNINTGSTSYITSGQTLSVNSLNGGTIYIMQGGTLNASSNINGVTVYVYGTFNFAGTSIQGSTNIYVASTGTLNATRAAGTNFTGGNIIVEGNVNITNLTQFQNSGTNLCYNNTGCTTFSSGVTKGSGSSVSTSSRGYVYWPNTSCPTGGPLTSSSNVRVCTKQTSAGSCTFWGTATVTYNCPYSNCSGFALPIQLVFFKANATTEGVATTWGINKSWDSDYFVIERSKNGIDWEEVGNVPSVPNTNKYSEFLLYDKKPYSGLSYYRLSEVDVAGQKTIYAIRYVAIENTFKGFSMYPNPSNGELNVNIFGEGNSYDFVLYDITGRKIHQSTLSQGLNALGSLISESGVYVAKLKWASEEFTQKLVIQ